MRRRAHEQPGRAAGLEVDADDEGVGARLDLEGARVATGGNGAAVHTVRAAGAIVDPQPVGVEAEDDVERALGMISSRA